MISIEEAIQLVHLNVPAAKVEEKEISNAVNHILQEDIFSPIPLPGFDQSAMDGYAVNGEIDLNSFEVIGEIKAGDNASLLEIKKGQAYRIFTGAMIPNGTTSIAKQEIVTRIENTIELTEALKSDVSIRRKGEEIENGNLAIPKGTLLKPAVIGFLASLGINKVKVNKSPKVAIIVTGNEIVSPYSTLTPGKIFDSNAHTLSAAFEMEKIEHSVHFITDNLKDTISQLKQIVDEHDFIITTGGISVGDYDFVQEAFNQIGVSKVFYKVNQKPGKPLFFGKKEDKLFFGLPGNPAAVLTSYYIYVLPAIKQFIGHKDSQLSRKKTYIAHDHFKKGDRGHFLKGNYNEQENSVSVNAGQSSAMLSSFAEANCLIYIPSAQNELYNGDEVEIVLLPY